MVTSRESVGAYWEQFNRRLWLEDVCWQLKELEDGWSTWLEHVVVTLWSGDIERRFFDSLTGRIVPDSACKCTILIDEFDGKTGVVADINWKGFITWKSHLKVLSCFLKIILSTAADISLIYGSEIVFIYMKCSLIIEIISNIVQGIEMSASY